MDPSFQADDVWDAGDMGCGELIFLLAQRTRSLGPGRVLDLIATDLGAPHDIPAWCRMTGNALLVARPPHYLIRSKES
ncbi:MAG: sulfurtransferase TusA family protein [Deltaproteobacteria bacterium]|nr:sulfurtransferase TusA family protein [Deltaproteobacteria bacterium]